MNISPAGLALIKEFEGLERKAYRDVAGVLTIGYGHTGPDVKEGQTITKAEAEQLLQDDVDQAEAQVAEACLRAGWRPTQGQFDALVSWVFNLGIGRLVGDGINEPSTAYKRMCAGAPAEEVADALTWWNKALNAKTGRKEAMPGLVRRRNAEAALFRGEAAPKPKPLAQTKTYLGASLALATAAPPFILNVADQLEPYAPILNDLATTLKPYAGTGGIIATVVSGLTLAGIGLVYYGRWKLRREALTRAEGSV